MVTWDVGGADANWSTPENWTAEIAPAANDQLVFPVTALQKTNVNDFAADFDFGSILIAGSGYSFSGNSIDLFGSVTSNGTGNTFDIPVRLAAEGGFANTGSSQFTVANSINTNGFALSVNTADYSATTLLSGVISAAGSLLTGGNGITAIAGANSYSGTTTVISGTLAVRNSSALGAATGTVGNGTSVTSNSASIQLEGAVSVGDELLSVPSGINLNLRSIGTNQTNVWQGNINVGAAAYIYSSSNNTLRLDGTLSGNDNFNVVYNYDSGILALHGSFSSIEFLGIYAGTLEANTILTSTGQLGINTNATLASMGTFSFSANAISGSVNPGTSTATAILNNSSIALQSKSNFTANINGITAGTEYNRLNVTGSVAVASNLNVVLGNGFTPALNDSFAILTNDGTDAISGTFNGLPEGGLVNIAGNIFDISYTGGTGNDATTLC